MIRNIRAGSSGSHARLPQRALGLLEQLKGHNRPPFRQQSASPFRSQFAMLREREVDAPQGGVVFLQGHARQCFTISESLTLVLSETSILSMLSATSLANAANNGLVLPLVVDDLTAR